MIMKSFQGEDFNWLYNRVKREFYSVRTYKAQATRKGNAEIYIIARNYIGGWRAPGRKPDGPA